MSVRRVFLFAQGLAEFVQRGLDLVGERVGAILRGVENALASRVQQARDSPLSAAAHLSVRSIEHRSASRLHRSDELYVGPRLSN